MLVEEAEAHLVRARVGVRGRVGVGVRWWGWSWG